MLRPLFDAFIVSVKQWPDSRFYISIMKRYRELEEVADAFRDGSERARSALGIRGTDSFEHSLTSYATYVKLFLERNSRGMRL